MAKNVMIDEIYITLRIPTDRPNDEVEAIRETLARDDFMDRLRRAIRNAIRAYSELAVVRIVVSR